MITNYEARCAFASQDQGITELVQAMKELGLEATIAQTGGFTMCAYIELPDNKYIYANTYGAGLYGEDDFIKDIYLNESEGDDLSRTIDVAKGIANWLKENK